MPDLKYIYIYLYIAISHIERYHVLRCIDKHRDRDRYIKSIENDPNHCLVENHRP